MQPKNFICRVYILEGEDIVNERNPSQKPDTYLVVSMGDKVFKEVEKTTRKNTDDPEYYVKYDFLVEMPGAPFVRIEAWQHHDLMKDEMLGFTEIDMEERHFHEVWNAYEKKPIEKRPLKSQFSKGTFGNISCWIELIPQDQTKKAAYDIRPPEKLECELRVIVFETLGVPFKDKVIFFE